MPGSLNFPGQQTASRRTVFFTNKNINATDGSRTAILATSSNTKAQVATALLNSVLVFDPFQHDAASNADGYRLLNYTQAQANYLGMKKVVVTKVLTVADDNTAEVEIAEHGEIVPVKVNSGIDLTAGLTELHAVAGQWYVGLQSQDTSTLATAIGNVSSRLASFVGVSLATIASGANSAVTVRNIQMLGRGPMDSSV
jgi:hypothetical protein